MRNRNSIFFHTGKTIKMRQHKFVHLTRKKGFATAFVCTSGATSNFITGLGFRYDIFCNICTAGKLISLVIWDLDGELLLKSHNKLHPI